MAGPYSSNSSLLTHNSPKVGREAKMEPPSHVVIDRSGGAMTRSLVDADARVNISVCNLSAKTGNKVEPPETTMFIYNSFRMSLSLFRIAVLTDSWTPEYSKPRREGWKRTSPHLNRSFPISITLPSGNSYACFASEEEAISSSKFRATHPSFLWRM